MFSEQRNAKLVGVHSHFGHQMPLTIAHLLGSQHFPVVVGPLQHDEIDIGETLPARCLRQGLWLARQGTVPFALLLAHGTYIEIAVPPGEAGAQLSRRFLDELEEFVSLHLEDHVHDNLLPTAVDGCKGGHRGATTTIGPDDPDRKRNRAAGCNGTRRSDRSHGSHSGGGLSSGRRNR
jgi:hypothetical protein